MPATRPDALLRFLRHLGGDEAPLVPDAELLRRFAREADRSAFELLLWRHGPMVLGACRAVLHDAHDAEDAFQAAFLTLARKAGSIGRGEALAAWLYRVARRIAVKLDRQGKRRSARECHGIDLSTLEQGAPPDPVAADEVRRLLHAEVERLPAKYRAPVVLCYLEGRTNEEAAAQLGWSKGTVSGRLARARDLLRLSLRRAGLPISGGLALTLLTGEASAAVPEALVSSTLHAAVTSAAGAPLTGVVSPRVLSLAEGASTAMTLLNFKLLLGVLLGLTTAGAIAYSTGQPGGDKAKEGDKQAAPAVKVVRVPSPQEGILLAVGTEVKDSAGGNVFKVRVGNEVRTFRRLREGDTVKEGQMLAQLDDRLARNEVAIKRARVAAAQADLTAAGAMAKEAQARLDRLDDIKRQNPRVVSTEEYSGAVLTRDKHREEAVSKKEQVKLARLELDHTQTVLEMYTIRSPVNGVLHRILKRRGEGVRKLETVFEIRPAEGEE